MHEAVLADEIAAAGPALPVVRAPEREVPLEIVLLLDRVERRRQRGDLVVDALLLRRQRHQAAVTVVDQADRRRETQFDRPLRDRQCVLGLKPPPSTELMLTLNAACFASICSFASSTFRLFFDTSSGVTLSMLICR